MFLYQSMFRKEASGKAFKIIFLTILSGIFMTVSLGVMGGVIALPAIGFYDSPWVILYILFCFFLFFLFCILFIYPLTMGIIRFFTRAYNHEPFGFSSLFFVFKEGRYLKAVKLTVIVVVLYFVFSMLIGFVGNMLYMLVNAPLSALGFFEPGGYEETWTQVSAQAGLIITVLLMNFLVSIIMFIPYILLSLYIGLIYLAFVDQPMIPTMDKFKIAWDVMFKAGESIVKLFFSNLLLIIGVWVLYFVVMIAGGGLGYLLDSPGVAITIIILGAIISFILYIYILYIMIGSVVSFYFMGRKTLDARVQVEDTPYVSEEDTVSERPDNGPEDSGGLRPL